MMFPLLKTSPSNLKLPMVTLKSMAFFVAYNINVIVKKGIKVKTTNLSRLHTIEHRVPLRCGFFLTIQTVHKNKWFLYIWPMNPETIRNSVKPKCFKQ